MMTKTRQLVKPHCLMVLALATSLAGIPRPALSADWLELFGLGPGRTMPTVIVVEADDLGANAKTVAEAVAVPIEQQVNGVERMWHMRSRCTSQGGYALQVVFEKRADVNTAQVLVQNRVALALPLLPDVVKNRGTIVRKECPGPLAIVTLHSPDGSRDARFLGREAIVNVRDELARLPGTGQIRYIGPDGRVLPILLKPKLLASQKLTIGDVLAAIRAGDPKSAPAQPVQPPVAADARGGFTIAGLGKLIDPDQLGQIVLKTDANGGVIRLKDVARFESGPDLGSVATLDGKPVVALAVYLLPGTRPQQVVAGLRDRLAELQSQAPKGVSIHMNFDFAADLEAPQKSGNDYLLVELIDADLAGRASAERVRKALDRCQKLLTVVPSVENVLALHESPFALLAGPPCLIVRLAPADKRPVAWDKIANDIRSRLAGVKEASARVRGLLPLADPAGSGWPVDMVVYGPEADKVKALAGRLAKLLRESKKATDVWSEAERPPAESLDVRIDRARTNRLGVSIAAISETLAALDGIRSENDTGTATSWQVKIDAGEKPEDDLAALLVRRQSGEVVPLSAVASVKKVRDAGIVVERFDNCPMAEVTANAAPGVSAADLRTFCTTLFAKARKELGFADSYKPCWLGQ